MATSPYDLGETASLLIRPRRNLLIELAILVVVHKLT